MSFAFRSASDLTSAYRDGSATPSRVADRALAAIRALDERDPPMRLFIAVREDDVRAQAAASSERWRAGHPLGPLDGVPVAVKDEFDVIGYPTTCGTSFLGARPATRDALAVERLRRAGAILVGKTNMHELGVSPSGLNPHHGVARNPYDPAHDTGGSSSGSAAAVAAGIVPIALGNDGGGSIRIPAALCGVPGIKPTFGRVSTEGVSVLCWSLEHSGPIAATVADVVMSLGVVSGETLAPPPPRANLRIGVCEAWWQHAREDVAKIARASLESLARAGATLVPVELPHLDAAMAAGILTFGVEGAVSIESHLDAGAPLASSTRLAFDLARGAAATSFVKAQRVRALVARDFQRAFAAVDVVATPTTAATAQRYREDAFAGGEVDEANTYAMIRFTMPLNVTGAPAATVPCGYDARGLPVGLQIIGRHGDDLATLAVAAAVEEHTPRRAPSVWVDLLA